jgi:hypothetical protein
MTRKSKREIERLAADLEERAKPGIAGFETTITRALIVPRERAEREGLEILETADVPHDREHVRVRTDDCGQPIGSSSGGGPA